MKRIFFIVSAALVLAACSPVLNRELMREGVSEFNLNYLRETPEVFEGKLFILGGLIVQSRLTATGSRSKRFRYPWIHTDICRDPRIHRAGSLHSIQSQKVFSTRWCIKREGKSRWRENF